MDSVTQAILIRMDQGQTFLEDKYKHTTIKRTVRGLTFTQAEKLTLDEKSMLICLVATRHVRVVAGYGYTLTDLGFSALLTEYKKGLAHAGL